MNTVWRKFRRFWLEEEIPRWIGMSLVAAFLCGLGAVTYASFRQTSEMATHTSVSHGDHAMSLLARVLSGIPRDDPNQQHAALREFSRKVECEHLCVVDADGIVVASVYPEDVGNGNPVPPDVRSVGDVPSGAAGGYDVQSEEPGVVRRYYHYLLGGEGGPVRSLEAVLCWRSPTIVAAGQAWVWVIVLAAVGLLGATYHLMRRHFRGVACIADNLTSHADDLEAELASLRIADSLGAVACTWNKLIDLVESLRAEANRSVAASELRQVLERTTSGELADAVDAIPDGLFIIADEDMLMHCNASAARLMGWKQQEAARSRLGDLQSSETGVAIGEVVEKARGVDGSYDGHSELVETEGNSYRVRVVPQRNSRQHGACVVVVTDVSQQIRADRAREEFVSQVTHELRTPLTNIRAYSETLSSGMFDDPKVVSECYNVINKETRRLSRLIEDILSMSQLEVGSIQILLDTVDLRALIQESVRDVRAVADEKNIDLQAVLPAKLDPIQADRDKLAVVLNNLLGNAMKYTPAGGEVRIGCQSADEHVMITVKDTGIGIDVAEQDHVFEKFHRSADPDVQNETGTGIGLTTAREITRRHGGDIELVSEKGKGSTFVVRLPRPKNALSSGGTERGTPAVSGAG